MQSVEKYKEICRNQEQFKNVLSNIKTSIKLAEAASISENLKEDKSKAKRGKKNKSLKLWQKNSFY